MGASRREEYSRPQGEHIVGTRVTLYEHPPLLTHKKSTGPVYTALVDGSAFPGYYESRHAAFLAATLLDTHSVLRYLEYAFGVQYANRPVTEEEVLYVAKTLHKSPNP